MAWPQEQKAEALRLRMAERKSLVQISADLGVPKGTLQGWLRDHPLGADERRLIMDQARSKARVVNRKDRGEESALYRLASDQPKSVRAKIAEAAVLLRLVARGFEVFGPQFDGSKSDWIILRSDLSRPLRLQVKLARPNYRGRDKHGLPFVSAQCADGRKGLRPYREGEIDAIAGYDLFTDKVYVWTFAQLAGRKYSTIQPEAEERWDLLLGL